MIRHGFSFLIILLFAACRQDTLPKPKGMLRLEYPEARYEPFAKEEYYQFEKNTLAIPEAENEYMLNLVYPPLKATLYLSYNKVDNNLDRLLADARKRSYEHAIRADGIVEQRYTNEAYSVYGTLYEVTGNAASQYQFYVTDSTRHFLTGALYFYTRPNYDSLYPAVRYIRKDIQILMETLRWK